MPRTINVVPPNDLVSFRITSDEVKSMLLSVPTGKGSEPDLTSNKILKGLAQPLSSPLKNLFNLS